MFLLNRALEFIAFNDADGYTIKIAIKSTIQIAAIINYSKKKLTDQLLG